MLIRTSIKSGLIFCSALLLSACVQVPFSNLEVNTNVTESPVELPPTYVELEKIQFKTADESEWIKSFNSNELEELIASGLENNPNLAATATRVLDSEALVKVSSGSRLPNLNAGLSAARAKSQVSGTSFIGNNFDLGVSIQWEIDLWGKLRDQTKADILEAQASKQLYNAAKLSLSANIAKAYFNLLTESELLTLFSQNTQNIERIEAITVRSFKRGLVNALDVQLARRDLASSRRALLAQENTQDSAARTLEILLGGYPEGEILLAQALPDLTESIIVGAPAQLLERRPDLQAAALQMLASEKDVAAAKNALLPSIVLTGSAGTSTNDLKNIFDNDFSVWSLLGNLAQPVLNRSTLKANLELEKNAQERAKLEYIDLVLQAMNEVETSLATEGSLRQQVAELTTARDYARQSSIQAKQQYEKGLVNANTLLSTETQYLSAEQSLLRIKNLLLQNRVSLYIALGGDVENNLISSPQQVNSQLKPKLKQSSYEMDIAKGESQ